MNAIGERGPIKGVRLCPIHTNPPPFVDQSTTAEVLKTGIKVVDLLAPSPMVERSVSLVVNGRGPIKGVQLCPIHADPSPFIDQSTTAEVLKVGIKVVDLLAPYAHGGEIGLFGGEWGMRIESVLVVRCVKVRQPPLSPLLQFSDAVKSLLGVRLCPIHANPPPFVDQSTTAEVLKTGIKVVDLLAPYARGGKIGFFGGAGPRGRLKVALVFEYFRAEEGQDVLLFINNIFQFTQAGSEISALLGCIPSAVGYQPTLSTDMGGIAYYYDEGFHNGTAGNKANNNTHTESSRSSNNFGSSNEQPFLRFPSHFSSDFGPSALLYAQPTLSNTVNYGEVVTNTSSSGFSILRPTMKLPLGELLSNIDATEDNYVALQQCQVPVDLDFIMQETSQSPNLEALPQTTALTKAGPSTGTRGNTPNSATSIDTAVLRRHP
ncbi:hypothetical protein BU15DRAFT_80728 [Melanogaster broomeanus]|nr:hypothetical protein BU15DRAFT_80728 [Melanogaster broomeanus]